MTIEPKKKERLTFDEAAALIEDVARNGEGAQKLRALQMVMANEASTVTLPAPLSTDEVVDRMERLMRAVGTTNSQVAYRHAFGYKREIFDAMPKIEEEDVPAFYTATLPKSLKQLYRQFPEIKRGGYPAGYPRQKGLEAQQQWCQKKAREILRTREEERLKTLPEDAATKQELGPDER